MVTQEKNHTAARDFYDEYWGDPGHAPPAHDPLRERRVALLVPALSPFVRLLDVGCGDGRATPLLRERCPQTVGIDISLNALQAARQGEPTASWVCASLEDDLPFASGSFDVLHCCEVIEHLLDVPGALRAMHRVLRPGGLLFLSTPYHGWIKNSALALFAFDRHFDPAGPHIRFFTLRSLTRLLHQSGFSIEKKRCLGRFWPVWMNLVVWARKE
ncbi:MAG: class I SAM-dependent methyltransferase [Terriglobia bacterium]